MDDLEVLYEVRDQLALITINRAEKHNAISLEILSQLQSAVSQAAEDASVRVIAITGAGGRSFASGSDLNEVLDRDLKKAMEPIVQGLAEQLENLPIPTIAAIDGICMGGGLEVALGCDLRICTPHSRFATPEGKLGIIPGGGATARLPRIVGAGWAMEMMLMGDPIQADEAFRIGLLNKLTPKGGALAKAKEMVAVFADRAPLSLAWVKRVVYNGMQMDLRSAIDYERFIVSSIYQTADRKEGIGAFLEKRDAKFKGE